MKKKGQRTFNNENVHRIKMLGLLLYPLYCPWLLDIFHQRGKVIDSSPASKSSAPSETKGAFHLVKISGISGSVVNGTRFAGSSHWKIPRKSGKSKKVVPFSRLEFPNGMSCSKFLVVCTSSRSKVGHRHVPEFTVKWNNFLPIGNSTFPTTEISGVFS